MKITTKPIGWAFASLTLLALQAVTARADGGLTIERAAADYANNQITVTGSNFSPDGSPPTVALADSTLVLVAFSNQKAAASLPAGIAPGSYLLAVTNSAHQTAQYRMTLGAAPDFSKLRFHAEGLYSPWAIAGSFAYAGLLQDLNAPKEWGQGFAPYGKRLASTDGCAVIHGVLALGLDSALHQDPRYFRLGRDGFWRRMGHAVRGTFLTHTDTGGETFATWRFGSAYGAAFLSNTWYPDRLDTVRLGFLQGSVRVGFDLIANVSSEFWPSIKKKLFHRG